MSNVIYITPTGLHDTETPSNPLTAVRLESEDPDVIEAFKTLIEEFRGYPRFHDWQGLEGLAAIVPRGFCHTVDSIDDFTVDLCNDYTVNKLADTPVIIKYRESDSGEWITIS